MGSWMAAYPSPAEFQFEGLLSPDPMGSRLREALKKRLFWTSDPLIFANLAGKSFILLGCPGLRSILKDCFPGRPTFAQQGCGMDWR